MVNDKIKATKCFEGQPEMWSLGSSWLTQKLTKILCHLLATRCLSLTSDLSNQMWCVDLAMARCTIPNSPWCAWPTFQEKRTLQVLNKKNIIQNKEKWRLKKYKNDPPVSSSRHWPGWWRRWVWCDWPHRCCRSLVCSVWGTKQRELNVWACFVFFFCRIAVLNGGNELTAPVVVGDDGWERSGTDAVTNQVDLLAEEDP